MEENPNKEVEEIDIFEDEEDDNTLNKLNKNKKDKKNIMYIVITILVILLVVLLIYLFRDKDSSTSDTNNNDNTITNSSSIEDNTEDNTIFYVSCDDNTTLLNVRNSPTGNITDGLSCYKEVTILDKLEGTDTCDSWYHINYNKSGNSYAGYVCGTYIKKSTVDKDTIDNIKNLIDKANDYYDSSTLTAYCGNTSTSHTVEFENNMTGVYYKSEYQSIDELKSYLLSFMDESIIDTKLELSDIDNPKYYDNYYEIDGNLYCRGYASKGYRSNYTNNYNIEVDSITDNEINVNIAYEYIYSDGECTTKDLSTCSRNDFVYEIESITIKNNIITKMDFHK